MMAIPSATFIASLGNLFNYFTLTYGELGDELHKLTSCCNSCMKYFTIYTFSTEIGTAKCTRRNFGLVCHARAAKLHSIRTMNPELKLPVVAPYHPQLT